MSKEPIEIGSGSTFSAGMIGSMPNRVSTQGKFTRVWLTVLRDLKYPNEASARR